MCYETVQELNIFSRLHILSSLQQSARHTLKLPYMSGRLKLYFEKFNNCYNIAATALLLEKLSFFMYHFIKSLQKLSVLE